MIRIQWDLERKCHKILPQGHIGLTQRPGNAGVNHTAYALSFVARYDCEVEFAELYSWMIMGLAGIFTVTMIKALRPLTSASRLASAKPRYRR